MTKEVLLSICGIQTSEDHSTDHNEPVEVITPAVYYYKNGAHYLLYDEADPEEGSFTHSTMKLTDDSLSVSRQGDTQAHLLIEQNKRNVTYYATPFGSLHIVLDGRHVEVEETEKCIAARAFYGLEINYDTIADCEIRIRVTPRGGDPS